MLPSFQFDPTVFFEVESCAKPLMSWTSTNEDVGRTQFTPVAVNVHRLTSPFFFSERGTVVRRVTDVYGGGWHGRSADRSC